MNKIDLLKERNIQALKEKDKEARRVYLYLLSKIKNLEKAQKKEATEDDLYSVALKMKKELLEQKNEQGITDLELIKEFLPKEISESELIDIVSNIKKEGGSIKDLMQTLKPFGKRVNRRLAKKLFESK